MNVTEFITKWERVDLKKTSASQERFLHACQVVDRPKPAAGDPTGDTFTF